MGNPSRKGHHGRREHCVQCVLREHCVQCEPSDSVAGPTALGKHYAPDEPSDAGKGSKQQKKEK